MATSIPELIPFDNMGDFRGVDGDRLGLLILWLAGPLGWRPGPGEDAPTALVLRACGG